MFIGLIPNYSLTFKETLSIDIVKEIIKNKDNSDITKVYLLEFIHIFNERHYKNVKEEDVDFIIESDCIIYRIFYDKDIDYAYKYFVDGSIYKVATFLMYGRYYSVNNYNYSICKYSAQDPIFFNK